MCIVYVNRDAKILMFLVFVVDVVELIYCQKLLGNEENDEEKYTLLPIARHTFSFWT